jgi:glutathione S-transferase
VNALLYQSIIRTPENLRKPDVIELHRVRNEQSVKLLDDILSEREFIAGIEFTLADIAIGPLIHRWFNLPVERPEYKFVRRWYDAISERSAFIEHVKSIPFS